MYLKSIIMCPSCNSIEGYELIHDRDNIKFVCKDCGATVFSCSVYSLDELVQEDSTDDAEEEL